jgi:hypothetical protein
MPNSRFLNGCDTTEVAASRKGVYYMVDFHVPDEVRDKIPSGAIGILKMEFYADPPIGATIKRFGHRWKIIDIEFEPTKWHSRETKLIPTIITEYIYHAP